jgi:DNA-binding HxlR family transcriptional regulator
MVGRIHNGRLCPVAQALDVVGERWTFLILRDALLGVTRFDSFLTSLGIARTVLTDRLNGLVRNGIFVRVPYQDRPVRHEYQLTTKGRELVTIIVSLMEWGDRHLGDGDPPRVAVHAGCEGRVRNQLICATCGRPVSPDEVATRHTG